MCRLPRSLVHRAAAVLFLLALAPELPADGWSARFERTFRLTGGEYLFMGEGEGGIRAWVGDKFVVDEWNPAPGPWRRSYGFVLPEDADVAARL